MQTGCIIEIFSGKMLSIRAVKQNIDEAENFIINIDNSKSDISGIVYWATYVNEQEAVYGWFISRSSGYGYPNYKLYKQNRFSEFSTETVRRRTTFATSVVLDTGFIDINSEQRKTLSGRVASSFGEVPHEDWVWRLNMFSACNSGQNFPLHPNNEVEFFIRMMRRRTGPVCL